MPKFLIQIESGNEGVYEQNKIHFFQSEIIQEQARQEGLRLTPD